MKHEGAHYFYIYIYMCVYIKTYISSSFFRSTTSIHSFVGTQYINIIKMSIGKIIIEACMKEKFRLVFDNNPFFRVICWRCLAFHTVIIFLSHIVSPSQSISIHFVPSFLNGAQQPIHFISPKNCIESLATDLEHFDFGAIFIFIEFYVRIACVCVSTCVRVFFSSFYSFSIK